MAEEKDADKFLGVPVPRALTVGVAGALIIGAFHWYDTTNTERVATKQRETQIMDTLDKNTEQLTTIRDTMATEDDVAAAKQAAITEAKREARMYTDSQLEPISRQQATIDANLDSLKDRTISVEQEVTKGFDRMDTRLREIDRNLTKQGNVP